MRILIGMSGGVDSSTVACMLKEQGHEVIGATMSIWDKNTKFSGDIKADSCFSPHEAEDVETAKAICKQLDIPYYVVDCSARYKQMVLDNFKSEYKAGRTPNPCVICNSYIKFHALPEEARAQGIEFDKFATGHYAQIRHNEITGRYEIMRGVDNTKDQSYFLYRLNQEQLSQVIMPLGAYTKAEVRKIAAGYGLAVSDKPDSQDFYSGDINDILQNEPQIGNFVTTDGRVLGQHKGIWNYTVGQRRGMGIAAERPLYVLGFNKDKNEVVVGFEEECERSGLIAGEWCWSAINGLDKELECEAKIRSSQQPTPVRVIPLPEGKMEVKFFNRQKAIAAGQSVVLYQNNIVLGGGIIESSAN
ncbi:MAG: tRNA 2-thiouridine(34) synthase MnmA [Alphaproteobacteria bacterium]|nr:tRNA 2-thiouridine(34) synthase MnmA [Alphaproteobacteria bacterium]